ncbi:ATPases of the AAA+ class [Thermoplasmatales archaeon BRNA1]|nr:ATPases of the AAA+ class [Thermoplasmatales archaeon BRNA1]
MGTNSADLRVISPKRTSDIGFGKVWIDAGSFRSLGLPESGSFVTITGRRTATAFAEISDSSQSGTVIIDGPTRTSAGASVNERVAVSPAVPREASRVTVAAVGGELTPDESFVRSFRSNIAGRGFSPGQQFIVPNISLMGTDLTFRIERTDIDGPFVVTGNTDLKFSGGKDAVGRGGRAVTYDDIGGLSREMERIRMMVEWPINHPELFSGLGITPPRGVLLYGPPGTGKTLIAEAIANESGASFYSVRGPELVGKYVGWSENNIRELFDRAAGNTPSIIFFDEIDSIASQRDGRSDDAYRNMLSQILTCMDGLGSKDGVIVIGATNRPGDLDPAIRRPGRFDREIEIGIPDLAGRREILAIRTSGRGMPMADDVDLDRLAKMTQGFVGADITALAREAAMQALSRTIGSGSVDLVQSVPDAVLSDIRVTMDDFVTALASVKPSGMREISGGIPEVSWADIGGMESVRREIMEDLLPGSNREAFERLGISQGRGVLLYGPPGTGKTLIAKALANENGYNFIPVNGPELMGRFHGDTEEGIRKVFDRAKSMAPSIIFFDEIDSVAPMRGADGGRSYDSMVAQLLTCLDGVSELKDVLVLAATNRPDMIDPAVLRPGRIDRMILIGKPDERARLSILKVCSAKMPLNSVDLAQIAGMTDGYVGADLAAVCREAGLSAFHRGSDAVGQEDFESALEKVRPSVDQKTAEAYEKLRGEIRKSRDRWANNPLYG